MIESCWKQVAANQGWHFDRSQALYKDIIGHYKAPTSLFHNVQYLTEAIYFASEFCTAGLTSHGRMLADDRLTPPNDALKIALYFHAGISPGDDVVDLLTFVGARPGFIDVVLNLIMVSNSHEIANDYDIAGRTIIDATLLPFIASDYPLREDALLAEVVARPDVQNIQWLTERLKAIHARQHFFMHPAMSRFEQEGRENVAGTIYKIEAL